MLLLTSTSDVIKIVTGSAADVDVHASFVDNASGTITPGRTNTEGINTATTTTVVAAPGSSTQRNVKHLNITNRHASTSTTIVVQHFDGTLTTDLMGVTLLAGENLVLDSTGRWAHHDVSGGIYAGLPLATQAEMEAPSSVTVAVPPGRMHNHPGVAKFVCMTTGTATPSLQTPPAYNMTSITDTGVGRLTVTIATDFSSATWCCVSQAEMASTTLTEAGGNVVRSYIRNASLAVGTVEINTSDFTGTTHVVRDPVSHHVVGFGDQA